MPENSQVRIKPANAALESVDDRMVSIMRLILALSALVIIYLDSSEPDRFVAATYGALIAYSLYSCVLCFASLRLTPFLSRKISSWVDVCWFLVLIALSSGTNSIFFFFFFFAILVESFRRGFKAGFRLTLVSTLLFTVIGYATVPTNVEFELNRFLLRPVYLLVLGYMIAYWGGQEIRLKRRLNLLKEIARSSGPASSVSRAIGEMLLKIRVFYDAEDCWLILHDVRPGERGLFRLSRLQAVDSVEEEQLPVQLSQCLLAPPPEIALVHNGRSLFKSTRERRTYALDLNQKKECTPDMRSVGASLAARFELPSFISVPVHYRNRAIGRFYVTGRPGIFDDSDIDFLSQVVEQMMPGIHNIKLMDRLAENERQRLARDIHDSVIQPYLGLQYKVAAIRNKFAGGANVRNDIDQLFEMTTNEVTTLRGFTRGLREKARAPDSFLEAAQRFASEFADNYNLDVRVESEPGIKIGGRLGAELLQIVQEGLSNVRKHTESHESRISLGQINGSLQLCIENNEGAGAIGGVTFVPRSITERAEELGGRVLVERNINGRTIVKVNIPLMPGAKN